MGGDNRRSIGDVPSFRNIKSICRKAAGKPGAYVPTYRRPRIWILSILNCCGSRAARKRSTNALNVGSNGKKGIEKGRNRERKREEEEKRRKNRKRLKGTKEREREKDVYNLGPGSCVGPDMQKRGCRTELEYPRGLIWISIYAARTVFLSPRCFYPRGPLLPMYLPLASRTLRYPPSAQGVGSRTRWNTAKDGGKERGQKKKGERGAPLKILLRLPGEQGERRERGEKGSWKRGAPH